MFFFLLVAQKPQARRSSSFNYPDKIVVPPASDVAKGHTVENEKPAESNSDKVPIQDLEVNRKNKFRRYGLLANAKARRKSSGEFSSNSDSEDCSAPGPTRKTSSKKTSIAKAMKILNRDNYSTHTDKTSKAKSLLVS